MKPKLEARVYRKGRLICAGYNSYEKSSKLQRKYGGWKRPFVHAELDAIREAIYHVGIEALPYCELRVERFKADGSLGLAKPCECCQRALEAFKFRAVYYTTEKGWERL